MVSEFAHIFLVEFLFLYFIIRLLPILSLIFSAIEKYLRFKAKFLRALGHIQDDQLKMIILM